MHALVLAAALFVPGSAEDPAVLVESCRDYLEYEHTGTTEGNPALCLGYLAGFASALGLASDYKYTEGKANICFREGDAVSIGEVARRVVEMSDAGWKDMGASTAVAVVALNHTNNCDR